MILSRQWKAPPQKKSGRKGASDLLCARPRHPLVIACCIVAGYRLQLAAVIGAGGRSYELQSWSAETDPTHEPSDELRASTGIETSAGFAFLFFRHLSLNGLPILQHLSRDGGALLYERRAYLRGKQAKKLFEFDE
jgi:hypothetical protein